MDGGNLRSNEGTAKGPTRPTVAVVGAVNRDTTFYVDRIPVPGETTVTENARDGLGGKAANQAIRLADYGGHPHLIASVGTEDSITLAELEARGVDVAGVQTALPHTGRAFIVVEGNGENRIIVEPGANASTTPQFIRQRLLETQPDAVLVQGELGSDAILACADFAAQQGARLIINLAPFVELPLHVLRQANPLIVNEVEAGAVIARYSSREQDDALLATALRNVVDSAVITLGGAGSVAFEPRSQSMIVTPAAAPERVVDTTGAGDAFIGTLVAVLVQGGRLPDSLQAASIVAARIVGVHGAST